MANIIPALLTDDIQKLQGMLDTLAQGGVIEWAQIDFMDGQFVNTISIKPEEIQQIRTQLNLEAHLMVADPVAWLPFLPDQYFRRVYFHFEAVEDPGAVITEIRNRGFEVGIALKLETPLKVLEELVDYVDGFLLMAIEPGAQGRPFQPETLQRIADCAQNFPGPSIAVDGGLNETNVYDVAFAGAANLCVGSAIWAKGEANDNIRRLQDILKG